MTTQVWRVEEVQTKSRARVAASIEESQEINDLKEGKEACQGERHHQSDPKGRRVRPHSVSQEQGRQTGFLDHRFF